MRVFVPVDDEWDGKLEPGTALPVPYRVGVALMRAPASTAPAGTERAGTEEVREPAAA